MGDIEVENWFDIPRANNEKGDIRTDLFAFALKNTNDKDKIILGEVVNLICWVLPYSKRKILFEMGNYVFYQLCFHY